MTYDNDFNRFNKTSYFVFTQLTATVILPTH